MSTLVLDQSAADRLLACHEATVLHDPSGTVIGVFDPTPLAICDPGTVPEFDEAELDRREERWEGIPSAEVRRRLERLR